MVTVNFTFSPEVRPTSEGSKKKSCVVTLISLTSGPGDGEVGVGVAVAAGRDVGVGVAVSEEPHAAVSIPIIPTKTTAKTRFDNTTLW